jgi:hypothetical protein
MALYQARLTGPTLLSATAAKVYDATTTATSGSSQASNVTIVKQIVACNTDTSAHTFTLYCMTGGDTTVGAADMVFNAVSLAAGETKLINLSLVLRASASDTLYAVASSANKINLTISGIEEY